MDRTSCKKAKHANGMTLVEVITTISISAILTAFAAPDMTKMIRDNRGVRQINDLQASLYYARSEAIMRNTSVVLCQSSNGTDCGNGQQGWQDGWIVFVDQDLDGKVGEDIDILRVNDGANGENNIEFTSTEIVYSSSGLATSGMNGTFTLCDDRGASHSRGLVVGTGGRVRLAVDGDLNGTPEDAGNNDLVCTG